MEKSVETDKQQEKEFDSLYYDALLEMTGDPLYAEWKASQD